MFKHINCGNCAYYDITLQGCREGPVALKKAPNDWCGRGWPDYTLDPKEVQLYQGLLMTVHRNIGLLLADDDRLDFEQIRPKFEAWYAQASKLLEDKDKPKPKEEPKREELAERPPNPNARFHVTVIPVEDPGNTMEYWVNDVNDLHRQLIEVARLHNDANGEVTYKFRAEDQTDDQGYVLGGNSRTSTKFGVVDFSFKDDGAHIFTHDGWDDQPPEEPPNDE